MKSLLVLKCWAMETSHCRLGLGTISRANPAPLTKGYPKNSQHFSLLITALAESSRKGFSPVIKLETMRGRTNIWSIRISSSPGKEKYLIWR